MHFGAKHLPTAIQEISAPFGQLALLVASRADNPETTAALRKLLGAKDCAVRAALARPVTVAAKQPDPGTPGAPAAGQAVNF